MAFEPTARALTHSIDSVAIPSQHAGIWQLGDMVDLTTSVSSEYRRFLAGLEEILAQVARRLEALPGDQLPGIADVVETVVMYTASAHPRLHGWYCQDAWHNYVSGQRFSEIVINADNLNQPVEEIFDTLVHELVHGYAASVGLRDTSRRGGYHNMTFADLAMKAGLVVHRHPTRGCTTVGISPLGYAAYGDLIEHLELLIRLHRDPSPSTDPGEGVDDASPGEHEVARLPRYVMARCDCQTDRGRPVVIRVARGSWDPGTIWCKRCDQPFRDPDAPDPKSGGLERS